MALMVLLVLTVGAAELPLGLFNMLVALGIAVIKAALIVMFFMHFRDSDHLTWLVGAGDGRLVRDPDRPDRSTTTGPANWITSCPASDIR